MRNALILLGLFFLYSIVGSLLGYASNFVGGHYIASSDQPGSTIWLFLRGALPHAIAAAGAGVWAFFALMPPGKVRWAAAFAILVGLYALAGWSFGFHWRSLDSESQIGWLLQSVFVGGTTFVAFLVTSRVTAMRAERAVRPNGD